MKTNMQLLHQSSSPLPISYENAKYKRLLKKWLNRDTLIQTIPISLPADISTWGEFPILLKSNSNEAMIDEEDNQFGESNY